MFVSCVWVRIFRADRRDRRRCSFRFCRWICYFYFRRSIPSCSQCFCSVLYESRQPIYLWADFCFRHSLIPLRRDCQFIWLECDRSVFVRSVVRFVCRLSSSSLDYSQYTSQPDNRRLFDVFLVYAKFVHLRCGPGMKTVNAGSFIVISSTTIEPNKNREISGNEMFVLTGRARTTVYLYGDVKFGVFSSISHINHDLFLIAWLFAFLSSAYTNCVLH